MAKSKTRGLNIKRTHTITTIDEKGVEVKQCVKDWFPCRVNAAVPFDHRMLK